MSKNTLIACTLFLLLCFLTSSSFSSSSQKFDIPFSGFMNFSSSHRSNWVNAQDPRRFGSFSGNNASVFSLKELYLSLTPHNDSISSNVSVFLFDLANTNTRTKFTLDTTFDTAYIRFSPSEIFDFTFGLQPSFFQISEKSHLSYERTIISYSLLEMLTTQSFLGFSAETHFSFLNGQNEFKWSIAQEPQGNFSLHFNEKEKPHNVYQTGFRFKTNYDFLMFLLAGQIGEQNIQNQIQKYMLFTPHIHFLHILQSKYFDTSFELLGLFMIVKNDSDLSHQNDPSAFSESGNPLFSGGSSTITIKTSNISCSYRIALLNKELQKSFDNDLNKHTPFYVWHTLEHAFAIHYFFEEFFLLAFEYKIQAYHEGLNNDFVQYKNQKEALASILAEW